MPDRIIDLRNDVIGELLAPPWSTGAAAIQEMWTGFVTSGFVQNNWQPLFDWVSRVNGG